MISPTPLISVVIRNRNEAVHLEYVLQVLQQQEYQNFEIILVDNNSTDNSVALAQAAQAKIISIKDFTYGRALNRGIEAANGELIVILSAHSVPVGRYFLHECAKAFAADETVAAARLIYVGKNADMTRWLETEVLHNAKEDFISKGPLASGCVIRRRVWEETPFNENAIAAEDKIWAAAILKKGYKILSPIAAFYYYRKSLNPLSELRKNYRELLAIHQEFGVRVGFVNRSGWFILIDLTKSLLNEIFTGVKNARFQVVRAYLQWRFPKF